MTFISPRMQEVNGIRNHVALVSFFPICTILLKSWSFSDTVAVDLWCFREKTLPRMTTLKGCLSKLTNQQRYLCAPWLFLGFPKVHLNIQSRSQGSNPLSMASKSSHSNCQVIWKLGNKEGNKWQNRYEIYFGIEGIDMSEA